MSTLATRLRDALVQLTPEHPEAIDKLRELYATDLVFRDPIQEVRGMDAFIAMNRRLMGKMRSLTWDITLVTGDESVAILEWTVSGTAMLGAKVRLDGVTRARARASDGLIVDHRDYWDLGELLASPIPGGQRILQFLRSPLG